VDRNPTAVARDAAYASIGLVVTAAEQARTRLSAVTSVAADRAGTGRTFASTSAATVSDRANAAARQVAERAETVLAAVRARTPEPVTRAVHDGIARARRATSTNAA
jgi:hypothetical protein